MPATNLPSPILEISNLRKGFGSRNALDGVSFRLGRGEVLSVIGPSGAGKTTLLRSLCLLSPPDVGTIDWPEIEVHWSRDAGRIIEPSANELVRLHRYAGVVFQGLNLWDDRSVLENITLGPRLILREDPDAIEKRTRNLCERLEIGQLVTLWAWQLSGGERQRVALARALMMQPRALLLDEITSALDAILTVAVMEYLAELRQQGLTMLIISHHLDFAARVSDRMLYLEKGRVIQEGPPSELFDSPADNSVKQFLSMVRRAR